MGWKKNTGAQDAANKNSNTLGYMDVKELSERLEMAKKAAEDAQLHYKHCKDAYFKAFNVYLRQCQDQQKKNKDITLSHHSDKEGENNNGEDKNGNHASV